MQLHYLRDLHRASGRLHAARTLDELLDALCEEARAIIGAHQCVVTVCHDSGEQTIHGSSLSDRYAAWRDYDERPNGEGLYRVILEDRRTLCLTQAEVEAHPRWRGFGHAADRHPPMRGWLASPILGSDGEKLGLIQLSDKLEGDFDDSDVSVLEQLTRIAALAIQKTRLLEAAQQAEAKLRRFIDSSNDLICTIDGDGAFSEVSANVRDVLGYEPQDLIGRPFVDYLHPGDRDRSVKEADNVRGGRPTRSFANRYVRRDGSIAHLHWSSVWSDADQLYYCVVRDMTDRVQLEQQFAAAQRMEAIGKLTGGMAHDFNNLLTIILGSAEALAESTGLDEEDRSLAVLAQDAALRGAELTSHLLAFARRQPLAPTAVDVEGLLNEVLPLVQRTIGEHLGIRLQLQPAIACLVDPAQLESAILNLCLNARDACASAGAGTITITGAAVSLDDPLGDVDQDLPRGDYVRITVADDGEGMTPDTLEHAFEPFFTTKEVGKGTGLGLSMVYGFVRQSGGHIRIDSQRGVGTTVKMYLPAVAAPAVSLDPPRWLAPAASRPARILVVEDDPMVRANAARQLSGLGYEVTVCGNGVDALAQICTGADFDLLFTDIVMPGGLNGRQLAERARRIQPALKVLFTSGYADLELLSDLGPSLLNKPYRQADLARRVAESLAAPVLSPST